MYNEIDCPKGKSKKAEVKEMLRAVREGQRVGKRGREVKKGVER